jgi:hypothetical protein
VIAVRPEALSTVDALGGGIRIEFSETISERPTSGLIADAVLVSPQTVDARVRHRGDAIEVELPGGMRPGVVYRVTVLPVLRDLFGNAMREPFEFVFSTGAELNPSAVVGLVVDRVTGRPTRDVTVLAVDSAAADPPVAYAARTDSGGVYVLRYLPPGEYALVGFLDRNRNRLPDPTEARGTYARQLSATDTVLDAHLALVEPDTTAARLVRAEVPEPALVRLTFDDYLDPEASLAVVGATLERVDGQGSAPSVLQLLHEHRLVALRREAARAADSAAAPATPTPPPDSAAGAAAPPRATPPAPIGFAGRAQGTDSVSLRLLDLTLPSRVVYAELSDSLLFSVDYVLRLQGVLNLTGVTSAVDTVRVSRGAPPSPPPGAPPERRR